MIDDKDEDHDALIIYGRDFEDFPEAVRLKTRSAVSFRKKEV